LRRLLDQLQREGHRAISSRVQSLVGAAAPGEADLVARLPVDLLDDAQATWFGAQPPPAAQAQPDAAEDRATGGAWWIDDLRYALRYRPAGHDDPWLHAWLDTIAALPAEHADLRDAALAEFRRAGAPGGCLRCHSVEQSAAGRVTINWRGRDRLAEPRSFTHFTHRPHVAQAELADCTACHQIIRSQGESAYVGLDPLRSPSEFAPMTKAACATCHHPHAAGDACTQCHNYHVAAPLIDLRPTAAVRIGDLPDRRRGP